MPWAKLDDSIHENRKLLQVSPAARWLFIASITFCRRNQTGGELLIDEMAALVRQQKVTQAHVKELLRVGLVEFIDYGYLIPDYGQFNPLTSKERTRVWREKPEADASPERHGDVTVTPEPSHGDTPSRARSATGQPVPVPVPVSTATSGSKQPESRPPWPEEELCIWFETFIGRQLSALEVVEAANWSREFAYMDLPKYIARIEGTAKARMAEEKPPHRTLMDYRHTVQLENTHRANSGLQKIGYQATGRNARMVTA